MGETRGMSETVGVDWVYSDLSKMIDHSLLNPTMDWSVLEKGVRLAVAYETASVCIMPYALGMCSAMLSGSGVKASTVIGFPHGGHTTSTKVNEAERALADGAEELDMVVNISRVLSGQWGEVEAEIRELTQLTHGAGQKIKVIFENCYLSDSDKVRLCEICGVVGADWVKTSTGYGTGGATIEDLKLMRAHSPEHVSVKAAGGVRGLDTLLAVRAVGANRAGATATVAILDEARGRLGLDPVDVERVDIHGY